MKKKLKLMVVSIAILYTTSVHAQQIYFNFGAGYGLAAAPNLYKPSDSKSVKTTTYDGFNEVVVNSEEAKNKFGAGSFGKGILIGGILGYMFNPNIGAELGVSYLIGTKTKDKYEDESKYIYLSDPTKNHSYSYISESTTSAQMLRFTPSIKFALGNRKISPYMKYGMVIGVLGKLKMGYNSTGGLYNYSNESNYTGGISLGFSGCLGVNYKLNDNMSFYSEMGIITQSWSPKRSVVTKSIENGIDQLPTMTTREKETEYSNKYSYTSVDQDESSPEKQLKMSIPFSSVGINLGLQFTLGNKKKSKE